MKTLNTGFDTLYAGVGKVSGVYDAAFEFGSGSLALIEGAQALCAGTNELESGFSSYADGVGQLANNYIAIDNGIFELETGANSLKNGFDTLQGGTDGLLSSMNTLTDSISALDRGAGLLYNGVDQMDAGENAFTSALPAGGDLSSLISMSENAQVVSFAAPGIVTPNSVQFVVKTPAIEAEEQETLPEAVKEKSLWEKFLDLFRGGK